MSSGAPSFAPLRLPHAGLLLPSWNIHAPHEEPKHQQPFRQGITGRCGPAAVSNRVEISFELSGMDTE